MRIIYLANLGDASQSNISPAFASVFSVPSSLDAIIFITGRYVVILMIYSVHSFHTACERVGCTVIGLCRLHIYTCVRYVHTMHLRSIQSTYVVLLYIILVCAMRWLSIECMFRSLVVLVFSKFISNRREST